MTDTDPTQTNEADKPAGAFRPAAATVEEGDQIALRALRATAFEYCDTLFWREDDGILSVSVNCSDIFYWGCADAEELTANNIALFEATFAECEEKFGRYNAIHAAELFCARARGLRPQGAYYKYLDDGWAALFDDAGPERETGIGNPLTPQQARERAEAERRNRDVEIARRNAERDAATARNDQPSEGRS